MDAVKYFKIKSRMTKFNNQASCTIRCKDCKLSFENNGKNLRCGRFELKYPEEAVAIMEEWAEEHPEKTCAQVFFERFPDAKKHENTEIPTICVETVGLSELGHICPGGNFIDCCNCWNAPAPDKYKDWGDR